jgi:hypothetical protein
MPRQACMPCWLQICQQASSPVCDGQLYTSSTLTIPCLCPCPKKENPMPTNLPSSAS